MNGETPQVRLQLVSNPLYLSGAREMISSIARRLGFSEEGAAHIALAVDEALCNVIKHGYDKRPDRPIWVSLFPLGGVSSPLGVDGRGQPVPTGESPTTALKIIIEDEARQVNLDAIKSRDLNEIRPGGLGVHIINEVMDSVTYEHREGGGMRLIMVKNRSGSRGSQPAAQGAPAGASCPSAGGESVQ